MKREILYRLVPSLLVFFLVACNNTSTTTQTNPTYIPELSTLVHPTIERSTLEISQINLPDSIIIGGYTVWGLLDLSNTALPIFKEIPVDPDIKMYEISPDHHYLAYLDNENGTGKSLINILDLGTLTNQVIELPYTVDIVNIDERYRNWLEFKFSPDSQNLSYISNRILYIYNLESEESVSNFSGPSANYGGSEQRSQLIKVSWISNECLMYRSFKGVMPLTISIDVTKNTIPMELYANANTLSCFGTNPTTSYFGDEELILVGTDKKNGFVVLRGVSSPNIYSARLSSNLLQIKNQPLPIQFNPIMPHNEFVDNSIIVFQGDYQFDDDGIMYLNNINVDLINLDDNSLIRRSSFEIPDDWGLVESYKPLIQKQGDQLDVNNILFTASGNPSELRIGNLESGAYFTLWVKDQPWIFILD